MYKWIVAALVGVVLGNWLFRTNPQPVRPYGSMPQAGRTNEPGNQAGDQPGTPRPGVNKAV